jgi:phosphatidylinositol 3-kinase
MRWGDWLVLPARYSDLTADACIALTVYDILSPHHIAVVGGTSFALFSRQHKLRKGKQRLLLHAGVVADARPDGSTPGLPMGPDSERRRIERARCVVHAHRVAADGSIGRRCCGGKSAGAWPRCRGWTA